MKRKIFLSGIAAILILTQLAWSSKETFEGEYALLRNLSAEEQLAYFGLQYLMNDHQKRQYLSIPTPEERASWIERFWIDLDPTPATVENERRIEHEKRVALARRLFAMKKAPGWDRRGETLIRWGLPTERVRTFGTVGMYRFTPPGEIWYYRSLDMIVQFSNVNLKGEYVYSSDPVGRTSRQELDRIKNISDLAKYGVLQTVYPIEYMTPDEVKDLADWNPDEIDYTADPDLRMQSAALKDLIGQWEREKLEKSIGNFYRYLNEYPTIYSFEIGRQPLPLYFEIASFRGGENNLRTDISFEIPAREIKFIQQEGSLRAEIACMVLARDLWNKVIAADSDIVHPVVAGQSYSGPTLLPGQITLSLPPGYYRLGIEAIDRNSRRSAAYRTNLQLRAFDSAPSISDIQFASNISTVEESARFRKGPLQVVPHPARIYRKGFPISVYFEIYNLDTSEDGLSYYRIEYRIDALDRRRSGPVFEEEKAAISSSFESSGYGSMQPQHLSIATENLWEGRFRFTVTVTDRRTFGSASKSDNFSVVQ